MPEPVDPTPIDPAPIDPAPIDPGPSAWDFGALDLPEDDMIAAGGDLEPATILDAYRHGLFPMPHGDLWWWSPLERGVLGPGDLAVSRSLRRSARRFTTRIDTRFRDVVAACADPARPHGWISRDIAQAYGRLHDLGWAHSVEVFDEDDVLVGGLYGLAIGSLFAGESMFHHATDASKVALLALVEFLDGHDEPWLIDTQWVTDHLASLGVRPMPRDDYRAAIGPHIGRSARRCPENH